MNSELLCMGCMQERGIGPQCPHCGWVEGTSSESPLQLPPRTVLDGRYLLGRALGQGGFGITYIAWDLDLDCKVAVKEYFPRDVCTRAREDWTVQPFSQRNATVYESGLTKFLEEGRALARFRDHPGVVSVLAFLRSHGTGYIVMGYIEGLTFQQYLENHNGKVAFQVAFQTLIPVMDTLRELHSFGLLHRDISPDNIYITHDQRVKLLDFGAARYSLGEQSRSLDVILKPGYAPEEQYRSQGRQGPWTDVYALGATMYRAITGRPPSPALDRLAHDDLAAPSSLAINISPVSEAALLKALALRREDRFQTVSEFQDALLLADPGPLPVRIPTEPPRPRPKPWRAVIAGATALIILSTIAAFLLSRHSTRHPRILSFSAVPSVVAPGAGVTLQWQTSESDEVFLNGKRVAPSGSSASGPIDVEQTFTLSLMDAKPSVEQASTSVQLERPPLPPVSKNSELKLPPPQKEMEGNGLPAHDTKHGENLVAKSNRKLPAELTSPPQIYFKADQNLILAGQHTTLHWSVTNATSVHIAPGFDGLLPEGQLNVSPAQDTRYTLLARGPGGLSTQNFIVKVHPVPAAWPAPLAILAFSVSPQEVRPGAVAYLSWEVQGAARVMIQPGVGVVPTSGSKQVRPSATTQYLLIASARDGSSKAAKATISIASAGSQ